MNEKLVLLKNNVSSCSGLTHLIEKHCRISYEQEQCMHFALTKPNVCFFSPGTRKTNQSSEVSSPSFTCACFLPCAQSVLLDFEPRGRCQWWPGSVETFRCYLKIPPKTILTYTSREWTDRRKEEENRAEQKHNTPETGNPSAVARCLALWLTLIACANNQPNHRIKRPPSSRKRQSQRRQKKQQPILDVLNEPPFTTITNRSNGGRKSRTGTKEKQFSPVL